MITFGLTAVALNRDTIEAAQRLRQEDLWETARTGIAVVLTNTEQLSSRGFAKLTDAWWCSIELICMNRITSGLDRSGR
jgi:hypothetical protein